MEDLPYVLGDRYAEVISLMWSAFLYSSLTPCSIILALISLCLFYWIDKYNLLRRSSLKKNIDSKTLMSFYSMLEFFIIMKALGWIIFDYYLKNGPFLHSFIILSIGLTYMILPKSLILNLFFEENFNLEIRSY